MKIILLAALLFFHIQIGFLQVPKVKVIKQVSKLEKVIEVLKYFEEFRPEKYNLFGLDYIGYGHLILPGESFGKITEVKATELLKKDLQIKKIFFTNKVPEKYLLLVSVLAYNVKLTTILGSRFLRAVKDNKSISIVSAMYLNFCVVNGKKHAKLLDRRVQELRVFY